MASTLTRSGWLPQTVSKVSAQAELAMAFNSKKESTKSVSASQATQSDWTMCRLALLSLLTRRQWTTIPNHTAL